MSKNVSTPQADVAAKADEWAMLRTLYGGTADMRKAGKRYLPQEPGESDEGYRNRLGRSVLFNAFKKTIGDMAGRVFAKEVALSDGAPQYVKAWAENIDLAGRHLNTFAMDVFTDGMQTGLSHILVEMPANVESETRASAGAKGIRPYLINVRAEDVLGWRSEVIDGKQQLTMLRIRETVDEPDGEYDVAHVEQIRVYTLGAYEVWRKKEGGTTDEWVMVEAGQRGIFEIPLSTFYADRDGFMLACPPLKDLADLNVCHWQSQSDQRNILHVARVPILFGAGFAEDMTLAVGAGSFTRASDPNATLSYVEHTGAAISSGLDDIKMLEFQMQAQGLQLLVSDPGKSATGEVRDDIKENSRLTKIAFNLKDALENALVFMVKYASETYDPEVLVNTDFGITARGSQDLQILLNAVNAGQISRETFWTEMMRRGVLSPEFDPEAEADAIEMQAPDIAPADIPLSPPNDTTTAPGSA